MLILPKYIKKTVIFIKNMGLLRQFKALKKDQHNKIRHIYNKKPSQIHIYIGNRQGKNQRNFSTVNRKKP